MTASTTLARDLPHEHRSPEWRRLTGKLATAHYSPPSPHQGSTLPTVGVAPDICPGCDAHTVLIACVAPSGHEVDIALAPDQALKFARAIQAAALKVASAMGSN